MKYYFDERMINDAIISSLCLDRVFYDQKNGELTMIFKTSYDLPFVRGLKNVVLKKGAIFKFTSDFDESLNSVLLHFHKHGILNSCNVSVNEFELMLGDEENDY